jgi:hypothetical protein
MLALQASEKAFQLIEFQLSLLENIPTDDFQHR